MVGRGLECHLLCPQTGYLPRVHGALRVKRSLHAAHDVDLGRLVTAAQCRAKVIDHVTRRGLLKSFQLVRQRDNDGRTMRIISEAHVSLPVSPIVTMARNCLKSTV